MFVKEIEWYEQVRADYEQRIVRRMSPEDLMARNEILFSCHSCAIEGNTFTVDDTRALYEQGLAMVPAGRSLLECMEIADHFRAFNFVVNNLGATFDEALLGETNRLVTEHTLSYRAPGAVPGGYTTVDMAAGDTVFGGHKALVARVPSLMASTARAIEAGEVHPMVLAARFHGFFEYLHPFRDGNGRTGRLLSNWILLRAGHPLLIIEREDRERYIAALRQIREEGTDEYLVKFFFEAGVRRMEAELEQKRRNSHLPPFVF